MQERIDKWLYVFGLFQQQDTILDEAKHQQYEPDEEEKKFNENDHQIICKDSRKKPQNNQDGFQSRKDIDDRHVYEYRRFINAANQT